MEPGCSPHQAPKGPELGANRPGAGTPTTSRPGFAPRRIGAARRPAVLGATMEGLRNTRSAKAKSHGEREVESTAGGKSGSSQKPCL